MWFKRPPEQRVRDHVTGETVAYSEWQRRQAERHAVADKARDERIAADRAEGERTLAALNQAMRLDNPPPALKPGQLRIGGELCFVVERGAKPPTCTSLTPPRCIRPDGSIISYGQAVAEHAAMQRRLAVEAATPAPTATDGGAK
jgi:hypothetical protein